VLYPSCCVAAGKSRLKVVIQGQAVSARRGQALCTEAPPRDLWRRDVAVVVVYPRDVAAVVGHRRWFDRAFALPHAWPDRRPLPAPDTDPPAPLHDADAAPRPPRSRPGGTDVTSQEFAALSAVQGYVSWLSTVAPHVSGWRRSVDDAQWSGVWSSEAVAALRYAWDMAPWLPQWERRVRVTAQRRVLHVSCDASTCSWAAVIRGDGGRVTLLTGSLPFAARAASTLTREAWGAALAIRGAVDVGEVFDHVEVDTDNDGAACTAGSGHSHAADAEAAMHALAAYEWQGLRITFSWKRRSEGLQPVADALSPAAGVEVWPIRSFVASYLGTTSWVAGTLTVCPQRNAPSPLHTIPARAWASCGQRCSDGWRAVNLGVATSAGRGMRRLGARDRVR